MLAPSADEWLEVRDPVTGDWERWGARESFVECGPEDRAYVCDAAHGTIEFAPAVRQADGDWRYYGAVPPKGATLRHGALPHRRRAARQRRPGHADGAEGRPARHRVGHQPARGARRRRPRAARRGPHARRDGDARAPPRRHRGGLRAPRARGVAARRARRLRAADRRQRGRGADPSAPASRRPAAGVRRAAAAARTCSTRSPRISTSAACWAPRCTSRPCACAA